MKKWILSLIMFNLIMFSVFTCHAAEKFSKTEYLKMRNFYLKQMEKAHPTPMQAPKPFSIYGNDLPEILKLNPDVSVFQNANTIDDESQYTQKMQNESSIAVNPTNPLNMVASAVDYRASSSTWVYVSNDGGKTWENKNLGKPFDTWRSTNDPSVGFSADGTAYLMYGGFEADNGVGDFKGGNAIFFARSEDEGKTWKAHIPVIIHTAQQTADSSFEDKYYIESDNSPESPYSGRIYTPWKRVIAADSSTQIMFAHSTDKGSTWSKPVEISPRLPYSSEDTTFGQSFALVEAAPNGDIYAAWNNGIYHSVGFNKSTDGGITWGESRLIKKYNIFGTTRLLPNGYRHTVKGKVRAESYPIIRCDHSGSARHGWVYLVWTADSIPNVYFSRSTDGGDTWSDAVIVNQDLTNDQFWAWLAVDPITGDIGVMYFDSRRDPDNMLVECWVSLSTDGGETSTDRAASSAVNDLRLNPFTASSFAGDYSGMDFYDGVMYPSWVDMRYAGNDINDSDVFTAIVDTRAPLPPEDFETKIFAAQPATISLSWLCPKQRSFGQKLTDKEYYLQIVRNGEVIDSLAGGTIEYTDKDLTPHEYYTYQLSAISLDGRASKKVQDDAYAGGSEQPGRPVIMSYKGSENLDISLNVKLPSKRKDGVTPLANMAALNIYRDANLIETRTVSAKDTSLVVTITDTPERRGWYQYHFSIVDDYNGVQNISDPSDTILVYTGEEVLSDGADYNDSFDAIMEKYHVVGLWKQNGEFFKTPDYSLSSAVGGEYQYNQSDTLLFLPIDASSSFVLGFWHAAAVHPSDKAILEYSTDGGKKWIALHNWNQADYEEWQDGELNSSDWKPERFSFENLTVENVLVRFIFTSNQLKNAAGWYIDNLFVSRDLNGISEKQSRNIAIFPNPARDYLMIHSSLQNADVMIYNLIGEVVIKTQLMGNTENKIDISTLPKGTYFIRLGDETAKFVKY